jgi:hypothetical protein
VASHVTACKAELLRRNKEMGITQAGGDKQIEAVPQRW